MFVLVIEARDEVALVAGLLAAAHENHAPPRMIRMLEDRLKSAMAAQVVAESAIFDAAH